MTRGLGFIYPTTITTNVPVSGLRAQAGVSATVEATTAGCNNHGTGSIIPPNGLTGQFCRDVFGDI